MQRCSQEVNPEVMTSVTKSLSLQSEEQEPWMCPVTIATALTEEKDSQLPSTVAELSREALGKAQEEDPVISKVLQSMTTQKWSKRRALECHDESTALMREKNRLFTE